MRWTLFLQLALFTWPYNGLTAVVRGRRRVVEGGGSDPSSGPRQLARIIHVS
jgi:hypothetical protein